MKPLSEQALEEEILAILRYPNGKRPPRNSIAEEIRHEQADKLLDLILSDRKAYGEYVIEPKIICGFAGIGKSTAAKHIPGVVDLESTPFNKDWELYAAVASHMVYSGYTVLVSAHIEFRDTLHELDIEYVLAFPPQSAKDEYIERYKERGSSNDFIKLMSDNWDGFHKVRNRESKNFILVENNLTDTLLRQRNQGEKTDE